ncbi:ABC transporter substrate-binding protein [Rhizobium halophytocola]|uniref:Iron complex transport system substrate-binding protein n=2 Tax=Rhizobium halophytocola TaxID=735519 RepID=A0ABS4E239_9HYPH|nr:iron complex transport system substrate-binding protein [Rhizobium halophytocola]
MRFAHVYGETVLDAPASRVVSLGYTSQDPLLALGLRPLAVRQWFGDQPYGIWPWAQPLLGDAQPRLIAGEVSMEIVASLSPDLIVGVGSGITRAEYDILSQIAPVLMQPPERSTYGMRWDELTLMLGQAVGKPNEASALVARTRGAFAAAKDRHPDWAGKTGVCAYHFGGDTGAFVGPDTRASFLSELGFRRPAAIDAMPAPNSFYLNLSPEDLSPLDADILVWVSASNDAGAIAGIPLRKTLKAHRQGREVFAGALVAGALSFGSVLSLPYALDSLEADMVAALDGRPETRVASSEAAGLAP